ncbi:hypothetical protein [Candidatus Nanosynbacter sp. TM7-053]|uniref:hypothetical protein n=1 Tax=Candidatus Nanosynbacter sp. TM7-053 TaxID=2902634 RepID=UPI001FB68601|nr:hypothetical protein [Candidatus Nanosynbacter sp. TM7-053]MCJ1965734.1 hypothetical protein [Candidatus Nanosynbacter sp. TM7-053]
MNNHDIIKTFLPKQLDIKQLSSFQSTLRKSNIIVYGEIHGIKENSDIIYTLVKKLGVKRLAIEVSSAVLNFINSVKTGSYDFSLVDEDLFDSSILSLEMIKTIAILLQQNQLKELIFIDTFFDNLDEDAIISPSPQEREKQLAKNILGIDSSLPTLCIMGQWHTQPEVIKNGEMQHKSALYRLRKVKPNVPSIHNVYRQGQLFNDGKIIELPENPSIPPYYEIVQKTDIDFDLHIPEATKISLCKK